MARRKDQAEPAARRPPKKKIEGSPWLFEGREVLDADVEGWESFVYVIRRISTGKTYVGKKTLKKRTSKPPLQGKTRRRRTVAESDWRSYWGSSPSLHSDIEQYGVNDFVREIVRFCRTKGEASYHEAKLQIETDALLKPDQFYNESIMLRVHRSHVLPKEKK